MRDWALSVKEPHFPTFRTPFQNWPHFPHLYQETELGKKAKVRYSHRISGSLRGTRFGHREDASWNLCVPEMHLFTCGHAEWEVEDQQQSCVLTRSQGQEHIVTSHPCLRKHCHL